MCETVGLYIVAMGERQLGQRGRVEEGEMLGQNSGGVLAAKNLSLTIMVAAAIG